MQAPWSTVPSHQALEDAGRAEIVTSQEQANVQVSSGFEFDPADPLMMGEDGREPKSTPVLLDHLGRGPHVGVETHAEMGELRLEGGRRYQSGVSATDQVTAGVTGKIVGPCFRLHPNE